MSLPWRRLRLSFELLIGPRLATLAVVDVVILLFALVTGLTSPSESGFEPWLLILLPGFLVGLPTLSDVVALERRAGSLDLALASPGADRYFERRGLALWTVLTLQGILVLLASRLFAMPYEFALLPAILKAALANVLLVAASLFCAVRLKSPGAVLFGTLLLTLSLAPWLFPSPIYRLGSARPYIQLSEALSWSYQMAVLAVATVTLYLYARRRLDRPETLLT